MALSNKVIASTAGSGLAGACTIILTYLASAIWKVEVPSEVAQAMTMVISTVTAGIAGYAVPHTE